MHLVLKDTRVICHSVAIHPLNNKILTSSAKKMVNPMNYVIHYYLLEMCYCIIEMLNRKS